MEKVFSSNAFAFNGCTPNAPYTSSNCKKCSTFLQFSGLHPIVKIDSNEYNFSDSFSRTDSIQCSYFVSNFSKIISKCAWVSTYPYLIVEGGFVVLKSEVDDDDNAFTFKVLRGIFVVVVVIKSPFFRMRSTDDDEAIDDDTKELRRLAVVVVVVVVVVPARRRMRSAASDI